MAKKRESEIWGRLAQKDIISGQVLLSSVCAFNVTVGEEESERIITAGI